MRSFDHDSSFLPRTHDDTNKFSHDINPIIEHKFSHSSHDEGDTLRVPPSQVDNLSSKFDKLETWLTRESHNPNIIFGVEVYRSWLIVMKIIFLSCVVYLTLLILMLSL